MVHLLTDVDGDYSGDHQCGHDAPPPDEPHERMPSAMRVERRDAL
jgi:hypothetical protein